MPGVFSPAAPRPPRSADYALALGIAGLAILCRAVLERLAPGSAYLQVLLPAVVLAGAFLGTLPGLVTAAAGLAGMAWLFFAPPLLAAPPLNSTQVSTLAFVPACAATLWATHALRRMAASAAAAEARLAEVFRQIPGAAAILEAPDGRLLLRSSQSHAVLNQPERQLESAGALSTYGGVHDDGRRYAAEDYPIVRALRTGEIVHGEAMRYLRPDGRMIDLEVHAGPVRDSAGGIVASVGMAFDVSQRVEAERRLRESEARYRATAERLGAAIDAGTLGLWELDLATRRVRLDPRYAAMLGLPAAEVELDGPEMERFIHPDDRDRARRALAEAVAAGRTFADETRMLTAQGEARWFVTRGAVLPAAQPGGAATVLGAARDVTERRQREKALEAALASRDILMREADHRIKNSLQLVTALLRLQRGQMHDPDARDALDAAMARVAAVADAHLALQRSPDLKTVEIDRILRDLCDRVGLLNPAVAVRCAAAAGLWLDAELAIPLGLIASEVLTNALRHAFGPGEPGTVTLAAEFVAGVLRLTIEDDGVGMPVGAGPGGLGTTVVNALAKQIGATLAIRSAPGAGTCITLEVKVPGA